MKWFSNLSPDMKMLVTFVMVVAVIGAGILIWNNVVLQWAGH